jgi:alkyl hydroperoxide reductase subunit AhpF
LTSDEAASQLETDLQGLVHPVRLVVFSAPADAEGQELPRLCEQLARLDSRLSVELHGSLDEERAAALGISRGPAVAVLGADQDYGVRFYGRPVGHERATLLNAIVDVSRGESDLAPETRQALAALHRTLHIQAFSTPT